MDKCEHSLDGRQRAFGEVSIPVYRFEPGVAFDIANSANKVAIPLAEIHLHEWQPTWPTSRGSLPVTACS